MKNSAASSLEATASVQGSSSADRRRVLILWAQIVFLVLRRGPLPVVLIPLAQGTQWWGNHR